MKVNYKEARMEEAGQWETQTVSISWTSMEGVKTLGRAWLWAPLKVQLADALREGDNGRS